MYNHCTSRIFINSVIPVFPLKPLRFIKEGNCSALPPPPSCTVSKACNFFFVPIFLFQDSFSLTLIILGPIKFS